MSETKLATRSVRMQYWADIIRDRNESGMTVKEYCCSHNISKDAYFYWLRIIRQAALDSTGIGFVELKAPEKRFLTEPNDFKTEAVVSIGNVKIQVNSCTSKELLVALLEVAGNVK